MIFVIQAMERLKNDEYGDIYYKLIKNMISGVFYDEKSPLNYSESIFSEQ
jgi:hypothetical protein|nr:MAG TPA: hypothetical protein [Caudoviricetes sp.]